MRISITHNAAPASDQPALPAKQAHTPPASPLPQLQKQPRQSTPDQPAESHKVVTAQIASEPTLPEAPRQSQSPTAALPPASPARAHPPSPPQSPYECQSREYAVPPCTP